MKASSMTVFLGVFPALFTLGEKMAFPAVAIVTTSGEKAAITEGVEASTKHKCSLGEGICQPSGLERGSCRNKMHFAKHTPFPSLLCDDVVS